MGEWRNIIINLSQDMKEDLSTTMPTNPFNEITPKNKLLRQNEKYKLPIISHHRIYLVNLYQRALQNLFPLIYTRT